MSPPPFPASVGWLASRHALVPPSSGRVDEAGVLPSGRLVLFRPSSVLRPHLTPSRRAPLSSSALIRAACGRTAPLPGRVSPVPSCSVPAYRLPYPGGFFGAASKGFTPSMAFAHSDRARLPLVPPAPAGVTSRGGRVRFMLRSVGLLSPPTAGFCHPASTAGSRPTPGVSYTAPWRLRRLNLHQRDHDDFAGHDQIS